MWDEVNIVNPYETNDFCMPNDYALSSQVFLLLYNIHINMNLVLIICNVGSFFNK